jgi:hypothetical protein
VSVLKTSRISSPISTMLCSPLEPFKGRATGALSEWRPPPMAV